jgi:hypothetical protein
VSNTEAAVLRAIAARFRGSPELDDLLAIARAAVYAESRAGRAGNADDLLRYSLRRATCDCIDYLRMVERQDPVRRPLIATSRTDSAHITFRVPAVLLSAVLKRYPSGSLSQSLRAALEAACER